MKLNNNLVVIVKLINRVTLKILIGNVTVIIIVISCHYASEMVVNL